MKKLKKGQITRQWLILRLIPRKQKLKWLILTKEEVTGNQKYTVAIKAFQPFTTDAVKDSKLAVTAQYSDVIREGG